MDKDDVFFNLCFLIVIIVGIAWVGAFIYSHIGTGRYMVEETQSGVLLVDTAEGETWKWSYSPANYGGNWVHSSKEEPKD